MSGERKLFYLPNGGVKAAQPDGETLDTGERLNLIMRTLATARLQRGEERTMGLFMAVGALGDVVRDEHKLTMEIATLLNEAIDRLNLLVAAEQRRQEAAARLTGPVRLPEPAND
jgi:hypothetical protein